MHIPSIAQLSSLLSYMHTHPMPIIIVILALIPTTILDLAIIRKPSLAEVQAGLSNSNMDGKFLYIWESKIP